MQWNALLIAAWRKRKDVVDYLLSAGANRYWTNSMGKNLDTITQELEQQAQLGKLLPPPVLCVVLCACVCCVSCVVRVSCVCVCCVRGQVTRSLLCCSQGEDAAGGRGEEGQQGPVGPWRGARGGLSGLPPLWWHLSGAHSLAPALWLLSGVRQARPTPPIGEQTLTAGRCKRQYLNFFLESKNIRAWNAKKKEKTSSLYQHREMDLSKLLAGLSWGNPLTGGGLGGIVRLPHSPIGR